MNSLEALFCDIDNFCQKFEPRWHSHLIGQGGKTRRRARSLCLSEIMTILVTFHQHHYRNFKHYYIDHVSVYWAEAFPKLPSYQRFIEWIPQTLMPLCVYLKHCFGDCTGISFIDSTCLKACHNRRISGHRVFKHLAARGKTSVETIIDQLKNISQIEHSRHRSPVNLIANVLCGLIAYCHQPKKPSLGFDWILPPSA